MIWIFFTNPNVHDWNKEYEYVTSDHLSDAFWDKDHEMRKKGYELDGDPLWVAWRWGGETD